MATFNDKIIYTSYLANVRNIEKDYCTPIFIASRWPDGVKLFDEYKPLAPDLKLIGAYIRKEITAEEYVPRYKKQLEQLNSVQVVSDLFRLCKRDYVPVLICYEKPEDFCHRHLVSQWLNENRFTSTEYGYPLNPEYF